MRPFERHRSAVPVRHGPRRKLRVKHQRRRILLGRFLSCCSARFIGRCGDVNGIAARRDGRSEIEMTTSSLVVAGGIFGSFFVGFLLGKVICLVENFFNDPL